MSSEPTPETPYTPPASTTEDSPSVEKPKVVKNRWKTALVRILVFAVVSTVLNFIIAAATSGIPTGEAFTMDFLPYLLGTSLLPTLIATAVGAFFSNGLTKGLIAIGILTFLGNYHHFS